MPGPKECNKIKDSAARARCLKYQGEFAVSKSKKKPVNEMDRVRSYK